MEKKYQIKIKDFLGQYSYYFIIMSVVFYNIYIFYFLYTSLYQTYRDASVSNHGQNEINTVRLDNIIKQKNIKQNPAEINITEFPFSF